MGGGGGDGRGRKGGRETAHTGEDLKIDERASRLLFTLALGFMGWIRSGFLSQNPVPSSDLSIKTLLELVTLS